MQEKDNLCLFITHRSLKSWIRNLYLRAAWTTRTLEYFSILPFTKKKFLSYLYFRRLQNLVARVLKLTIQGHSPFLGTCISLCVKLVLHSLLMLYFWYLLINYDWKPGCLMLCQSSNELLFIKLFIPSDLNKFHFPKMSRYEK